MRRIEREAVSRSLRHGSAQEGRTGFLQRGAFKVISSEDLAKVLIDRPGVIYNKDPAVSLGRAQRLASRALGFDQIWIKHRIVVGIHLESASRASITFFNSLVLSNT